MCNGASVRVFQYSRLIFIFISDGNCGRLHAGGASLPFRLDDSPNRAERRKPDGEQSSRWLPLSRRFIGIHFHIVCHENSPNRIYYDRIASAACAAVCTRLLRSRRTEFARKVRNNTSAHQMPSLFRAQTAAGWCANGRRQRVNGSSPFTASTDTLLNFILRLMSNSSFISIFFAPEHRLFPFSGR